ncbi:MAG: PSD1 domain-containing protein [Chloroflexi bacterium]|nr:PSD1 domain-containing protein [Chloroflexota bacterium]
MLQAPVAFGAPPDRPVDFARDIQPIFVKRCYECHGPDKQKSDLRLDQKNAALRGGKSGEPLFKAGQSSASEIIKRVTNPDPDEVMPPKDERLTPEQTGLLQAWIDQGGTWPDEKKHWAYLQPVRPDLPAVRNKRWPRNAIDNFILSRLEQEKRAPSSEADRAMLIRRLSLDLTGLPPTPAEVEAFQKDRSAEAYQKAVDRLLDSPHYGEHLARWWLDLARYADSNGYQVDLARSVWPYRQWVIDAFNRNLPFDQFTIEQIAGDLLPHATLEQKVATGFHRNSKLNDEGGGDAEEYRVKAVVDRVSTTATVWLGSTLACAECHSHKYDPFSQEEFYRLFAFFNNTADGGNYSLEPTLAVPAPPLEKKVRDIHARLAQWQQELAAAEKSLGAEQAAWEQRVQGQTNLWVALASARASSPGGATFTNLPDQSLLAIGANPIYDTYTVEAETDSSGITAILLEVLPDPSLPKNGPGRWGQTGNFILDEFTVTAEPRSGSGAATNLLFTRATADWEQDNYLAAHAIDRNPKTGWSIAPKFGQPNFLIMELKEPVGSAGGSKLTFKLEQNHGNSHTIGRFRLSVTSQANPDLLRPIPVEIAAVLAVPAAGRTEEQRLRLAAFYHSISPAIRKIERQVFRLNLKETELANTKFTTPVMQELPTPRKTFIHVRGNFLDKGKEVSPGVPAALPPLLSFQAPNRLTLARWLVDPENPLVGRVTVNRLWERFFGVGLVKTSEDFGRQGEAPTHPELLDWLATEFLRQNWDLKALQKLIVMSATYRQASKVNETLLERDPYNRLLARGPRFRMDAEMLRDQALAVSGLLNPEVGGPSVYPPQPDGLWKEIGFLRPEIGMDVWPTSDGADLYRRGLYTFWRRIVLYPTFAVFDAPSRDVCTSRRPRTNTPLQALTVLNDPVFLEAARALAQRVLSEGGSRLSAQIDHAFRLCLSRPPAKAERKRLTSLYEQQWKSFARDPAAAEAWLNQGASSRPPNLDTAKLAAWMVLANVLLNLDETLTKG